MGHCNLPIQLKLILTYPDFRRATKTVLQVSNRHYARSRQGSADNYVVMLSKLITMLTDLVNNILCNLCTHAYENVLFPNLPFLQQVTTIKVSAKFHCTDWTGPDAGQTLRTVQSGPCSGMQL